VWPPQATEATEPEIITENFGDVRFRRDGQIFVLAFAPEDAEIAFPPSVPELAAPSDLEAPSEPGSVDFTVPEGTEGDAPADGETTTSAPATETTAPATETTEAGG
jgi:hypothetical protein